jgi:hypothetical protein
VMGLRVTASIDYTIADKFVPEHRTFEYPFVAGEDPPSASAQGLIQRGQPGLAAFASRHWLSRARRVDCSRAQNQAPPRRRYAS